MIEDLGLYSLIFLLFALCIIFPPTEFCSAGLTLEGVFGHFLGDEQTSFVEYHLRRSTLTVVSHFCLPLLYFLFLEFLEDGITIFVLEPHHILQYGAVASIAIAIGAFTFGFYRKSADWATHPTVKALKQYDPDWRRIAQSIDIEYRRIDKFCVALGGIRRVVVTDSWVMFVSSYGLYLSQQSDVDLKAVRADEHSISHHTSDAQSVQFIDIQVVNTVKAIAPFTLRLNADMLRDLRTKLARPVAMARDVILRHSLNERFVHAFLAQVESNPRVDLDPLIKERLDLCLGCSIEPTNVKLEKNCLDMAHQQMDMDGRPIPNCSQCFCRPMWCVACMARIYAAKQEQNRPERWMSGKASCPTCRTTFCVLDVSFIN
uniref:Transmembrane protein 129 n=1 Tax=Plectus sambesii TaxID=2011161 RepID=A0A914XJ95_9BILA